MALLLQWQYWSIFPVDTGKSEREKSIYKRNVHMNEVMAWHYAITCTVESPGLHTIKAPLGGGGKIQAKAESTEVQLDPL